MKKTLYLLLIFLFIISCQRNEIVKTHGIAFLEKREKLIFVQKSNKNDIINIFGQPSTKGMNDDNLWIYIERTTEKGKLLKLGRNYLKKNNVLVLEFDKYGVLKKKEFSFTRKKRTKFINLNLSNNKRQHSRVRATRQTLKTFYYNLASARGNANVATTFLNIKY